MTSYRPRLINWAVGLGIVGVFVLFVFMAISAARESMRKMSCGNNLKQLGLALHTYHTTYDRLPPNGYYLTHAESHNPYIGNRSSRGSPLLKLETVLYYYSFNLNFDVAGKPGQIEDEVRDGERVGSRMIPEFLCPSSNTPIFLDPNRNAISCYALSMGAQRMPGYRNSCTDYPGNVFGTGPAPLGFTSKASEVSGVFARGHWAAKFRDITAGQSNVIMMGEILPDKNYLHGLGWIHALSPFAATTAPMNFPIRGRFDDGFPGKLDCHHFKNLQTSDGFRSAHRGGAQFILADGSTQFLSDQIDYRLYQQLGDRVHKPDDDSWR